MDGNDDNDSLGNHKVGGAKTTGSSGTATANANKRKPFFKKVPCLFVYFI